VILNDLLEGVLVRIRRGHLLGVNRLLTAGCVGRKKDVARKSLTQT
jgi:hypothetical protein